MSTDAIYFTWRLRKISPEKKLILLSLADLVDWDHKVRVSNGYLGKMTNIPSIELQKHIIELIDLNLIELDSSFNLKLLYLEQIV